MHVGLFLHAEWFVRTSLLQSSFVAFLVVDDIISITAAATAATTDRTLTLVPSPILLSGSWLGVVLRHVEPFIFLDSLSLL